MLREQAFGEKTWLLEECQVLPKLFLSSGSSPLPQGTALWSRLTTSFSTGWRVPLADLKHFLRDARRMISWGFLLFSPACLLNLQGLMERAWEKKVLQLSFLSLTPLSSLFFFLDWLLKKIMGKQQAGLSLSKPFGTHFFWEQVRRVSEFSVLETGGQTLRVSQTLSLPGGTVQCIFR